MNHIKKKYLLSMALVYCMTFTGINAQINQGQLHSMIIKDETLIAPGIGASSTVIDMPEQEVFINKGESFEKTQQVQHDLFKDVLKIQSEITDTFSLFIYLPDSINRYRII